MMRTEGAVLLTLVKDSRKMANKWVVDLHISLHVKSCVLRRYDKACMSCAVLPPLVRSVHVLAKLSCGKDLAYIGRSANGLFKAFGQVIVSACTTVHIPHGALHACKLWTTCCVVSEAVMTALVPHKVVTVSAMKLV